MMTSSEVDQPLSMQRGRRVLHRSDEADASSDDIDDSISTGTAGSVADDSSHCETPTPQGSAGRRQKQSKLIQRLSRVNYKCTNYLKEDHGSPIFCAQFNYGTRHNCPLVFATVGGNRVSIYECVQRARLLSTSTSKEFHLETSPKDSGSSESPLDVSRSDGLNCSGADVSTNGAPTSHESKPCDEGHSEGDKTVNANPSEGPMKGRGIVEGARSVGEGIRGRGGAEGGRVGEVRLLQAYTDADSDENLYTCAWTTDQLTGAALLAVAGSRGIVRIIDPSVARCVRCLIGHGQSINDVKFHPKDASIALSVSKDHTLRLWNITTGVCVAILGGVDGHRDEVLSADIDLEGCQVVSCGMDHSVKIWRLDKPSLQTAIAESHHPCSNKSGDKQFVTVAQHYPDFSTRDIHSNYVDCVHWWGRFVLSKSCENVIVCWKPGRLVDSDTPVKSGGGAGGVGSGGEPPGGLSVLHKFDLKDCDIWFMRFSLDYLQKILALGNQSGRVFVWDLGGDDPTQAKPAVLSHPKCTTPVRQTCLSRDGSILICVCDDSTIWRWDRL